MTDLGRILDERMNERIIAAINDLDFQQFQQLMANLLGNIGVKVKERQPEGDSVIFRGIGEEGEYLVMASRLFDHASANNLRRLKARAASEQRTPVLIVTNDLDPDAKRLAEREGISYADKDKLLLLLRKYELADDLMQEIDQRILRSDGGRVLPSASRFDSHMAQAIEHVEKARYKEALYDLDRALELKPNHDQVWQMRATALFNMGALEEAAEACQRALQIKPSDHGSWYLMGLIEGQRGDLEAEVKAYDHVLKLQPGNRSALLNKGTALYRQKKLDQALQVYEKMLKVHPNDAMAYNNQGIVLKAMGRKDQALESFARASALDRNYINPVINTGIIHSETGQHEEAISDWRRALQLQRRRPELWLSLATAQRATGDLEGALSSLGAALEIDPSMEEANQERKEVIDLLNPPSPEEEAPSTVEEVEEAVVTPSEPEKEEEMHLISSPEPLSLEVPPSEPTLPAPVDHELELTVPAPAGEVAVTPPAGPISVIPEERREMASKEEVGPLVVPIPEPDPKERSRALVRLLTLVGENQNALLEVNRALESEPEAADLWLLKAQALQAAGRNDEVLVALRTYYQFSHDERALYDMEAIGYRFGQRSEGMRILETVVPSPESLARTEIVLLEKGQLDEVITKAAKAGEQGSTLTLQCQALALMMKARYRDAFKVWKDILESFPGSAEALNNLGVCMRFMGEYGYEEPIHYMLLATIIDPSYADAHNNVGCVYFVAGAYEEALKSFEKALQIDRNPDYYLNLSSVHMALGNVEAAKQTLTSALKLEESAEVLYMLAVIAEKEGDVRWAAQLYEDALKIQPEFKDAIFSLQRVKLHLKYDKEK